MTVAFRRLLEQGPGLPDERARSRVPVDGVPTRLDEQLAVDQDDDDRRLGTLDEERLAGDERARRRSAVSASTSSSIRR